MEQYPNKPMGAEGSQVSIIYVSVEEPAPRTLAKPECGQNLLSKAARCAHDLADRLDNVRRSLEGES